MKNIVRNSFITAALIFISVPLCSCDNNQKQEGPILSNTSVHRDEEFGGAYIDISIQDFNNLGFKFGDSVSLHFETTAHNMSYSVTYDDIGYYSGYYVPAGQELLVGYPGYQYIKFCINYGEDLYTKHGFNETTKATIKVNKAGGHLDVEETLSITYSDDRTQYESDEQFANFREINVGNVKPGLIYRGASPIDNTRGRPLYVDELIKDAGIQYDIDLSDKEENIAKQDKYTVRDYFQGLMNEDKVIFLGMAAAYKAEDFANKMYRMFLSILNNDGPYYIHCLEGKDRTGYVCMVIEALCGATYEELIDDYFITYKNYYGIEKGSNKYNVIKELHIDEMIRYVFGFEKQTNLLTANYHSQANGYLLSLGLEQEEIDALATKLSKATA